MATDIGKLFAIIGADTSEFNRKLEDIGKRASALGKKMTMMLTLPILAVGAAAVKAGADFEYAMTNAWAVTGEGEEALAAMTAKAREMGATTIFSAKQAADAMYFMASAGWDSKKMADAIKPTLDLAAATQSELAFATETVIASMNQFQISTENTSRVTNTFAAAIMRSQATMEKLKISMTYIGPMAHSLGHTIEGTTAALMGLYNAGFEASTAGTALRMGLAKLLQGTGETKEGLERLGLSLQDVNPELVSMTEIVAKLEERGAKAADLIKIFGVRSGPAFAALIAQGSKQLEKFEKDITGTNAATEMADKQIKTFKGSIKLLTSIINEASIQIFGILGPVLKDLIDKKIRPAIEAFTKLSEEKKKTILKIAGLVAAAGPLLLIFGKFAIVIPKLISMTFLLGKALLFLATNPIGLLITVLGVVTYSVYKLVTAKKKLREETKELAGQERDLRSNLFEAAEAAGVSAYAFSELAAKYKFNYIAMTIAIRQGKEGVKLQKALLEVETKREEKTSGLTEEQKKLNEEMEEANRKLEEANKEMREHLQALEDAKEKAKEWAEVEEELGITSIEKKKERIKELEERLAMLTQKYEDGKYTAFEYANASKEIKDEIDALNLSLMTLEEKLDLVKKAAEDIVGDIGEDLIPAIEESTITLDTVGEVWNRVVQDMGQKLMDWGEMTGNIFKNVGMIFSGFIQEMIKGIGRLIIAELLATKKEILLAKTRAIAKAMASVFTKIPFPLNIIIAGTMFGVVGALFSKLMKFGKGADVWKPTLAVVGEEGPEVVRRRADYMRDLATARSEGGFGGKREIHLHQTIQIGDDKIEKKITKIVVKGLDSGEIFVPWRSVG